MSNATPETQATPLVPSIGAWSGERTGQFRNGVWGVRARDGRIIAAWAIDMVVVFGLATFLGVAMARASYNTDSGVLMGILVLLFFPWIHGFFCIGGNTLGTLIAGTRLVKLRDGTAPGFWRSGWLMFLRTVLFLLVPLNALLNAMNGDTDPVNRKHHVSIDKAATRALQRSEARA